MLLAAAPTRADEYNYQNLLVGTRSAGMGGADVALADSVTGTYYNPAGLVDAPAALISVSLSAYRLDMSGIANIEVRPGQSGRASALRFASFPLNAGLSKKLGAAGGFSEHALAFNVFAEDYGLAANRVDVRVPEVVDLYLRVRRQDQQTLRFATTWAGRRGRASFGVSPAYVLRVESVLVDTLTSVGDSVSYRLRDFQGLHGSLAIQAGVLWRLTERWRLGLSVTSPGVALHGAALGTELELRSGTPVRLQAGEERAMRYRTPLRTAAGVAVKTPHGFRFGAQATLHAPVGRHEVLPGLIEAEGRLVVNGNVGLEVPAGEDLFLRAGAFTNFAASPPPSGAAPELDAPQRLPHVDYYGATLGATLLEGPSSLDVSLVYQYGRGEIPSETSRGYDRIHANVVMLTLGGTYAFGTRDDAQAPPRSEAVTP